MFEHVVVDSFGGGLNFPAHPAAIKNNEWSWAGGFLAQDGYAEMVKGFTQIGSNAWLPAGYVCIGIVYNPLSGTDPALLGAVDGSGNVKLFSLTPTGTVTEITAVAGGTALVGKQTAQLRAAFLQNALVLTFGLTAGVAAFSLAEYTGGATFQPINDAATVFVAGDSLAADFIEPFRGHIFLGSVNRDSTKTLAQCRRSVAWSDVFSTRIWGNRLANSADDIQLDDVPNGVSALARVGGDAVGLFTVPDLILLSPTTGKPAFVRQLVAKGGANWGDNRLFTQGEVSSAKWTPAGTIVIAADNVFLVNGAQREPIGMNVRRYLQSRADLTKTLDPLYHEKSVLIMVPFTQLGGSTVEMLMFDAPNKAWSRQVLPSGVARTAYIYEESSTLGVDGRLYLVAPTGEIYREDPTAAPTGAFVDTKDFSFDEPTTDDLIDRLKLDWEPLTNATTDAVEVQAVVRNDLGKNAPAYGGAGVLGSEGLEQQTLTFTSLGTLTAGDGELPLEGANRLRGKYVRFRFLQSSGRVRIRGFTLRREKASDRVS